MKKRHPKQLDGAFSCCYKDFCEKKVVYFLIIV